MHTDTSFSIDDKNPQKTQTGLSVTFSGTLRPEVGADHDLVVTD